MKLRLKWKVFGFLLGFCGLLLLILWLLETVFLYDMYKFIRTREMNSAIEQVEKNIDNPQLFEIFESLDSEHEIMVKESDEFKPVDNKNKPQSRDKRGPEPRQETLTEVRDFVKADGSSIRLTFHALITPVDATVATLRIQLVLITGIMLILSISLAFLIARHVARPIEEVNKSAKSLAGGDYQVTFMGKGFVEIEELSDTLNTAAVELSKVEHLRRELLANIAHDLRTPLSLIYSYAEMMHDFPEEITQEQTRTIMEEANRLSSLVHDVFEISKLETGDQTLNLSYLNLTDEIGSAIRRLDELTKNDGYTLLFHAQEEVWTMADRVKIAQAVYNLLINAVNYGGKDKVVEVFQIKGNRFITIEVSDHGPGIAQEDLPYIWERYYKVDKKHKRALTGTGLGLSIVKKIIGMHGGNYGVKSELGTGSTFWFQIPLKENADKG